MAGQRTTMFLFTGAFLAALLLIVWSLVQQGRYDYAQNIAVKMLLWLLYTGIELRCGLIIANSLRAGIMAVIICDSLLGVYFDLYLTSSLFDKIQHVAGTYAFTLFFHQIICKFTQPVWGRGLLFIHMFLLWVALGALYEVSEFLGDQLLKPNVPSQTSLLDTDLDLIADSIGSLLAAIHATNILVGTFKK